MSAAVKGEGRWRDSDGEVSGPQGFREERGESDGAGGHFGGEGLGFGIDWRRFLGIWIGFLVRYMVTRGYR